MIAVNELGEWIRPIDETDAPVASELPSRKEDLGELSLSGEIVDSKCWFGAMRPSEGKVHKACAALCIQGGIPPAFLARDRSMRESLLILTNDGRACSPDLLPFVADPVRVSGHAYRQGDLLFLDAPTANIHRL